MSGPIVPYGRRRLTILVLTLLECIKNLTQSIENLTIRIQNLEQSRPILDETISPPPPRAFKTENIIDNEWDEPKP